MSKKVLLIYPGKFGAIYPELPLPLIYLAWALEKVNFKVDILDSRLIDYKNYDFSIYLFVGITSMTGDMIKYALEIAKYIKEKDNSIPIVWGGIHVSLLAEESLKNEYVDIVVRNEGEKTIQELAIKLSNNEKLNDILGVSFKSDGEIVNNLDRPYMNLDEIDVKLPYNLVDMDKYAIDTFPLHTSRGCPFRCGFCYNVIFNKRKYRVKSAEKVLDEIEYVIDKFGVKKISFAQEDEFFINLKRVERICKGIIERNIKIEWIAFCRIDMFDRISDELVELIEESGCKSLSFGVESGSQRMLDEIIKKDVKVEQVLRVTERLAKTNIKQIISFMVGAPTETDEDRKMSYDLLDKLVSINSNINPNGFFMYTPYPGTPMYKTVVEEYNYKAPQTLEEWSKFGIYRDVSATWHDSELESQYKSISIITRFPFYKKNFTLNDIEDIVGGDGRWSKFPFNIIYYIFTKISMFRWKKRFFKYAYEFELLEKVLLKMRGYV